MEADRAIYHASKVACEIDDKQYDVGIEISDEHLANLNVSPNQQWNEIIRVMNTQKAVTTTAQNNCDQIIQIRRCSEQNENVVKIYRALKYESTPFKKKKVVVLKSNLKKNLNSCFQHFNLG